MATIQSIIDDLHLIFDHFNHRFFDRELIKPVIITQSNGRHRLAMGWCTTRKIWKDTITGDFYYEITISAEFLYLGLHEICDTLLHEMVHLKNLQIGVKDCSRGNVYHNKKFKAEAERCGLKVEFSKRYGWSHTKLAEETIAFIDSLGFDPSDFALTRQTPGMITSPTGDSSNGGISLGDSPTRPKSRKYICPECGMSVRATRIVNLVCGDCQKTMTYVPRP